MFKLIYKIRKPFILFTLTLCLTLFLCLPWVSAKQPPKPQDWQMDGIVAALDDSYPEVKGGAFYLLAEYDLKDVKWVLKKPEDIALKAVNILKDEKVNSSLRGSAAAALGNLGEAGAKYAPDIANFLSDEKVDPNVRGSAAVALVNLGEAGAKYAPDIAKILFYDYDKVAPLDPDDVKAALGKIRKLETKEVVILLNNLYEKDRLNLERWRFFTYFLGGGTEEVKTLLQWLGYPQEIPTQLKYEDGKKTLKLFLSIWTESNDLRGLQKDLADKIAEVTRLVTWKPQDITLLQSHYNNLKQAGYNQADTIQFAINKLAV